MLTDANMVDGWNNPGVMTRVRSSLNRAGEESIVGTDGTTESVISDTSGRTFWTERQENIAIQRSNQWELAMNMFSQMRSGDAAIAGTADRGTNAPDSGMNSTPPPASIPDTGCGFI